MSTKILFLQSLHFSLSPEVNRPFCMVSQEEVKVFACKPSSKSCVLDPLPAMVLKGCFSVLLPTITKGAFD